MDNITNTIYKSNKISFEVRNDSTKINGVIHNMEDYRYVKAIKPIKEGDILLIEHCCVTKELCDLVSVVKCCPELFNNLYPRTRLWTESVLTELSDDLIDLLREKVQKNCFGGYNTLNEYGYTIGNDISRFNHSINFNAVYRYVDVTLKLPINIQIFYVVASKDVVINEEITIFYGNKYFGDKLPNDIQFNISKKYGNYIETIIDQYIDKPIFETVILNHMCIYYGLLFNDEMLCPCERFMEYYTKEFPNMQNIEDWISSKRELIHKTIVEF